jgi:hypothetical protein
MNVSEPMMEEDLLSHLGLAADNLEPTQESIQINSLSK